MHGEAVCHQCRQRCKISCEIGGSQVRFGDPMAHLARRRARDAPPLPVVPEAMQRQMRKSGFVVPQVRARLCITSCGYLGLSAPPAALARSAERSHLCQNVLLPRACIVHLMRGLPASDHDWEGNVTMLWHMCAPSRMCRSTAG